MTRPWPLGAGNAYLDYEAQPKNPSYRCDLCGAELDQMNAGLMVRTEWLEVVAKRDRYGFPVLTVGCIRCGLLQQAEPLAPAGLRALYSGPYRALVSAWHGREINAQTLLPEQSLYGQRLGSAILREWPMADRIRVDHARLLDLGGSTGMVAAEVGASLVTRDITVVEPSISEAAEASLRARRVVVQSAEDFDAGDERFDLILLCQTVDHLRSISAVLRKVRTWLAPGGRFFVDAVDSSLIPEPERYKIDHIYSLTPATMRAYLERAGFVAREVPAPSVNHVAFLCEAAE